MENDIIDFLRESNNIEGVFDDLSLQQAIFAWNFIIEENQLTLGNVLKTHKILMLHQQLQPDEKGYLRRVDVQVGGEIKQKWTAIPFLIKEWIDRMNKTLKFPYSGKDADQMSKSLHVHYEDVHPFVDGNGRTGRIFMNWWRIKSNLPVLTIRNAEKSEYYKWFKIPVLLDFTKIPLDKSSTM